VIQSLDLREDRFGFEPEVTARIAQGGYRVYEVGISYDGRTYAEGKKVGWVDGFRALYCIARYSRVADRSPARQAVDTGLVDTGLVDTGLVDILQEIDLTTGDHRPDRTTAAPVPAGTARPS